MRHARSGAMSALAMGTLVLLASCGREPAAYTPPPPPAVTVSEPEQRTIPRTLDFTGVLRGQEQVSLRARVSGFLEVKHVEDGQRVKAGDLLFEIDPRTYEAELRQAQAEVAAREADLRLAEVSLTRTQMALDAGAGNQQELDRAIADRDAAKAALELAAARVERAELDVEFTRVVSPIDGRIGFIDADVGDLISGPPAGSTLATVIDDARMFATYEVDERTVLEIRNEQGARRPGEDGKPAHEVGIAQAGEEGFPHRGVFAGADNTVDTDTGTIRVEAVFENDDRLLIPGAFVRLRAFLGEREALLVPRVAVLTDQAGRYVMVVGDDNIVQRVGVEIAGDPMDDMQPVRGVEAGEAAGRLTTESRVVINGMQRTRPGATVTPVTPEQAAAARNAAPAAPAEAGGE